MLYRLSKGKQKSGLISTTIWAARNTSSTPLASAKTVTESYVSGVDIEQMNAVDAQRGEDLSNLPPSRPENLLFILLPLVKNVLAEFRGSSRNAPAKSMPAMTGSLWPSLSPTRIQSSKVERNSFSHSRSDFAK